MMVVGKAVNDAMQHNPFYAPQLACQEKYGAMHKGNFLFDFMQL